jgi:cytochrome c oxidase cbb3-type subunit III
VRLRPAIFLLTAAALFNSCSAAAGNLPAGTDARHEQGRKLYNWRCYYCHGYSGNARTVASKFLEPRPRDFTFENARTPTREAIVSVLRTGRPGTAMKSYAGILSDEEMNLVADFVYTEFVLDKAPNTRYHTAANGWPDHERYRAAFPFVDGKLTLDIPLESLSREQAAGRRLYLSACVSCHDANAMRSAAVWQPGLPSEMRRGR